MPPKGKTDSDVAPSSSPIGSSAVDEDWFDVDVVLPEDEAPAKVAKRDERKGSRAAASAADRDDKTASKVAAGITEPEMTAPATASTPAAKPVLATSSATKASTETSTTSCTPVVRTKPSASETNAGKLKDGATTTTPEATGSQSNTASNDTVRKTFGNPFLRSYAKAGSAHDARSTAKTDSEADQQPASPKTKLVTSSASVPRMSKAPRPDTSQTQTVDAADTSTVEAPASTSSAVEAQTDPTRSEDSSRSTKSTDASSTAGAKSKSVLLANSRLKYAMLAAAAAVLGGVVIVTMAMPKRSVRALPPKAAQPARVTPPSAVAASVDDVPPISTVAAPNSQTAVEASAESSAVAVSDSAASAAPPGSSASAAASTDGFAESFQRNAAKKDAKWAEVKPPAGKASSGAQSAMPASGAAPANKQPVTADPLDVLKRLEDARKSKRQ